MKKIAIICAAIILGGTAFGERISLNTPNGSFSIELENLREKQVNEEKETGVLKPIENENKKSVKDADEELYLYNMVKKLKNIDYNFLSKLDDGNDREKSKKIINDIYVLLQVLYPDNKMLYSMLEDEKEKPAERIIKKPVEAPKPQAMSEQDFVQVIANIKDESFDSGKMEVVNMALADKPISLEQCARVLDVFPFDDGRVDALSAIYKNVIDKSKGYTLADKFTFSSTKAKAKKIIMGAK